MSREKVNPSVPERRAIFSEAVERGLRIAGIRQDVLFMSYPLSTSEAYRYLGTLCGIALGRFNADKIVEREFGMVR